MKKIFFLLMGLPCLSNAQINNLYSVDRVFPKSGNVQSFEKGLVAHEQKYHKGSWAWDVYTIESGPDAGGYRIVEGPMSWDAFDHRGNLGEAHQADYNKMVLPNLVEPDKSTTSFILFREDLSTAKITDKADKISINHIFPKPGYSDEMEDAIKKLKKAWAAGGATIAVYEVSGSGAPQWLIVNIYKQGLKEREVGFRKPFKDRFNSENGEGSWIAYQQSLRSMLDHSWSEILFYHHELSSK